MAQTTYNILAKPHPNANYILSDFIATKLTKSQFNKIKELNPNILGNHIFIPYNETDFTWWAKTTKYLTQHKLYTQAYFSIDYYGRVTKY